jgi:hypothetical protein
MKKITFLFAMALSALFFGGCATFKEQVDDAGLIQTVLNNILPDDYTGGLEGRHDGYYFGTSVHLEFDLHGLQKKAGRWVWKSGGYERKGFFSQGGIRLTAE